MTRKKKKPKKGWDRWDYYLAVGLMLAIVFTVVEPRIKANIIYDRPLLDFNGDLPEDQIVWEQSTTEKQLQIGVFNLISKLFFLLLWASAGMLAHRVIKKAGWM